jgi:epoxyqueuosine reductase
MLATPVSMHELAGQIKRRARELGFDLAGITDARLSQYRDYLRKWLDDGQGGTMSWLHKRFEERTDPAVYVPGAKSVICVAINYFAGDAAGGVARYARGDDYHDIIKTKLYALADWLRGQADCQTKIGVDTAPIMEKELAARAGIGWLGKNCCINNENIASWILLGEIITTLELPPDDPAIDRCGTCTRCIDSCPTGAITAPYQLDARKCISYLTIEHREAIEPALQAQMGDWLFGCDICQQVCPWNGRSPLTSEIAFTPRFTSLDPANVLEWSEEEYRVGLKGSAMKRVKLPMLQRNAEIVLNNRRQP